MSDVKRIELGEISGFRLEGLGISSAILKDAVWRHASGEAVTVRQGQQVSFHRYDKVELVVATHPGTGTFVMPVVAFREYMALSPVIPSAPRQPLQEEARPSSQKTLDLGWFIEYQLPTGGLPEHLVNDAIERHERGHGKEGQDCISHHVYGDGTAITLVTQWHPRVTFLMTCAVYDKEFKHNPLRYSEKDLQHFQDYVGSESITQKPAHTQSL